MPFTETAQQSVNAAVPSVATALTLTGSPNVLGLTAGVPGDLPPATESPALAGDPADLFGVYFALGDASVSASPTNGTKLSAGQSTGGISLNGATFIAIFGNNGGVNITLGVQT